MTLHRRLLSCFTHRSLRRSTTRVTSLLLLTAAGHAAAVPDGTASATTGATLSASVIEELARDPAWQRLLHYESRGSGRVRSRVRTPEFFLADDGATAPAHELAALRAGLLVAPATGHPDAHPRCRFPARTQWLLERGGVQEHELPAVNCPAYAQWQSAAVTGVTLVYATGYLGSPASYFGHLLLRFDRADGDARRAIAVNYGALVPDGEHAVPYVLKGLLGGYVGAFSHDAYRDAVQTYTGDERRDLWEFRLALTPAAVQRLLAHAWELQGQEFRYTFLDRNCAYRIAELLAIADGQPRRPPLPWTLPQAVVQRTLQVDAAATAMLPNEGVLRSAPAGPAEGAAPRPAAEAGASARTRTTAAAEVSRAAAHTAQETGMQHTLQSTSGRDAPAVSYRAAGAPVDAAAQAVAGETPASAHAPGALRAGLQHNARFGSGAALEFRGVYYDALDAGAGQIPHSALTIGDLRLALEYQGPRLQQLDAFRLDSVGAGPSAGSAPGHDAWQFAVGLAAQNLGCRNCTVARLRAARGLSWTMGSRIVAGAMLGGSLQNDRHGEGIAIAEAIAFTDLDLSSRWRTRVEYRHRSALDGTVDSDPRLSVESRIALGSGAETRLRYEYDRVSQTSLVFGWYW